MNDKADPQTTEQLNALSQKYDEALNKNDAVALVANFTEDVAVFVTDTGPIYGRKAIEKWYADAFQQNGVQKGSVATLQVARDRLVGCSSWPLRFAVYSSGGNLSRRSSCWQWGDHLPKPSARLQSCNTSPQNTSRRGW